MRSRGARMRKPGGIVEIATTAFGNRRSGRTRHARSAPFGVPKHYAPAAGLRQVARLSPAPTRVLWLSFW
jgi:hypothetical protein